MANWFVILFIFFIIRSSLTSNTLWSRSPLVTSCMNNGDERMQTAYKTTSGACALECHRRQWCNSFLYTSQNSTCRLCSLHYMDSDVSDDDDVTRYYRADSDDCPLSDGFLLDRASGQCLLVKSAFQQRVNVWGDAMKGCKDMGLNLVSLHTSSRLDFVINELRHNLRFRDVEFFIGGMRPESQWGQAWPGGVPDFQWLADGAKVDTNNSHHWAPGQPDNEQDGDNVLALGVHCWRWRYGCLTYPMFRSEIRNGDHVPNPCKPNFIWHGVGHLVFQGGGPRNPFGRDFANNGNVMG